jgi:hypothetical protein
MRATTAAPRRAGKMSRVGTRSAAQRLCHPTHTPSTRRPGRASSRMMKASSLLACASIAAAAPAERLLQPVGPFERPELAPRRRQNWTADDRPVSRIGNRKERQGQRAGGMQAACRWWAAWAPPTTQAEVENHGLRQKKTATRLPRTTRAPRQAVARCRTCARNGIRTRRYSACGVAPRKPRL